MKMRNSVIVLFLFSCLELLAQQECGISPLVAKVIINKALATTEFDSVYSDTPVYFYPNELLSKKSPRTLKKGIHKNGEKICFVDEKKTNKEWVSLGECIVSSEKARIQLEFSNGLIMGFSFVNDSNNWVIRGVTIIK